MIRPFYFILILFWGLAACDDSTSTSKDKNHFSNIIEVQQFGDSVRLEIEKRGNTLIKHYIDLKGLADDNFDNSYDVMCTYTEKLNDTTINSPFYITKNNYRLYFDQKKIASYCDSIIRTLKSDFDRENTKPYYENLKALVFNKNKTDMYFDGESTLMEKFNCKIVHQKTGEKPKSLLIEYYRTEFSDGKKYHLITNKGDTLKIWDELGHIK